MICSNCRRRLRADATSCLCGKFGAASQIIRRVITCCFDGCPEGAICRILTKTGWANVCLGHYPKLAREAPGYAPKSMAAEETRKIYEQSYHYRQEHGTRPAPEDRSDLEAELAEVKRKMEASTERQPGSDDELEQELLDRAQP